MIEQAIHEMIEWLIFPLWIGAGFADYLFHRRTRIEDYSGFKESLIHHLMIVQVGLPLLVATFFRIDAAVISLFLLCFIAHEITGNWDIRFAEGHGRKVSATEEQVHSFLEIIPLTAALLVTLPHFPQVLAVFGLGPEHADFSLGLKSPPVFSKLFVITAMLVVFVLGPYTEETIRCLLAQRRAQRMPRE